MSVDYNKYDFDFYKIQRTFRMEKLTKLSRQIQTTSSDSVGGSFCLAIDSSCFLPETKNKNVDQNRYKQQHQQPLAEGRRSGVCVCVLTAQTKPIQSTLIDWLIIVSSSLSVGTKPPNPISTSFLALYSLSASMFSFFSTFCFFSGPAPSPFVSVSLFSFGPAFAVMAAIRFFISSGLTSSI
jgi:hypothetical protein